MIVFTDEFLGFTIMHAFKVDISSGLLQLLSLLSGMLGVLLTCNVDSAPLAGFTGRNTVV